jgi:hypothetical protein
MEKSDPPLLATKKKKKKKSYDATLEKLKTIAGTEGRRKEKP